MARSAWTIIKIPHEPLELPEVGAQAGQGRGAGSAKKLLNGAETIAGVVTEIIGHCVRRSLAKPRDGQSRIYIRMRCDGVLYCRRDLAFAGLILLFDLGAPVVPVAR